MSAATPTDERRNALPIACPLPTIAAQEEQVAKWHVTGTPFQLGALNVG